jgi:hypothetical protein
MKQVESKRWMETKAVSENLGCNDRTQHDHHKECDQPFPIGLKPAHQLMVHTVVTGGQALLDTLDGAAKLVEQLDDAPFVIWLNPFWGPVFDNGKSFEQMRTYQEIRSRVETVLSLPAFTDELFPQDIAAMLKSRLTFKEAIESPDQSLMSQHRLKVAQREFYSRLNCLTV